MMDLIVGIKSKCSLVRNQRRYRGPTRLIDGHTGVSSRPGVAQIICMNWVYDK